MKQSKQERIEQILGAWDGAKRAEAPSFFYTRLMARMEKEPAQPLRSWLLRPVFLVAALVVVIIINAFIYFQPTSPSTLIPSDDETSIQSIAAEYNLSDNVLEDINQ